MTLYRLRDVNHYLDRSLFQAAISRKTLDAMFEAIFSEVEIARDILKFKAQMMGESTLSWYDLSAPLTVDSSDELSWQEAKSLVHRAFASGYPSLAEFTNMVYSNEWIDWSPRPGKRPGAFCTGSPLTKESRVYMTYNYNMADTLTLALDIGHACHG